MMRIYANLVGGFNPFEKYWSKLEFSQVGVKKNNLKPPLSNGVGVLFFFVGGFLTGANSQPQNLWHKK